MKTSSLMARLAAFVAFGLIAQISHATPMTYSNLNDFAAAQNDFIVDAAALGISLNLDDFNDVPPGSTSVPVISRADFSISHSNFNIRTGNPLFNQSGTVNNTGGIAWDHVAGAGDSQLLTFVFDTPINAFGIDLIDFGDTGPGTDPQFYINDILVLDVNGDRPNGDEQFVGLIDTMSSFSSVTLRSSYSIAAPDTIVADNVRYGSVSVPQPGMLALMVLGLAALGARRQTKGSE